MSEQVYTDVFNAEVVLTDTVRAVILTKHPEVAEFIENIGEVLFTPDEVRRSIRDERQVLYYTLRRRRVKRQVGCRGCETY